ncbi:MAG: rRNA maturation RNase YbeY [Chlamydiales bacterium]
MKVFVFNQQKDLFISKRGVKPIVKEVLSLEKRSTDELAIYFVSTEEISELHKEFFDDPSPTDCISFPIDQRQGLGYHILGEVFICPKTAIDYILKRGEEVNEDIYRETTLYLVHGLLHLLGYDDIEESDQKKMRAAENRHMHHLLREKVLLKG